MGMHHWRMCLRSALLLPALLGLAGSLIACRPAVPVRPEPAAPLVLYNWAEEIPPSVLAAFTAESGIPVEYVGYESTDEAVASLRSGGAYDVAILENRYVRSLIEEGMLAPLDLHAIPNFKNTSIDFRDLSFDPGNHYSVPFSWGTAGILARTDLLAAPPTAWADLWDAEVCGRVGIWRGQTREAISLALKMLGYSANSEDPAQLAEAQEQLLALRPCVQIIEEFHVADLAEPLRQANYVIGLGYAYEAVQIRELGIPAQYIMPQEGALLWSDSMVIPWSSRRRAEAEALINFLLRPEISAAVANANYYQIANEAALPLIAPDLRQDAMLYPATETLRQAEILLPLSAEGERRYHAIGEAFLRGAP